MPSTHSNVPDLEEESTSVCKKAVPELKKPPEKSSMALTLTCST